MIKWENPYKQHPPLLIRWALYLCGYLETGGSYGGKVMSIIYHKHYWFRVRKIKVES